MDTLSIAQPGATGPLAVACTLSEVILANPEIHTASIDDVLPDVLQAIRIHLGMDIAFISEFLDGRRIFRYVDSAEDKPFIQAGDSHPLPESYCQRVVDGRLPYLIQDARQVPAAAELPVTHALPVGAHLSVPIRLADGRVYGTFCCFSVTPDPTLSDRDLAIVRIFAEFTSAQIDRHLKTLQSRNAVMDRIIATIDAEKYEIVYQPIYNCNQDRIVGFESLTRFPDAAQRSPDTWFAEATTIGLGGLLEVKVLEKALTGLNHLPEDIYLSLNVSPANILSGAIAYVLKDAPLERIVLEVTEHVSIPDYCQFETVLAPLRQGGLRLAIDDAGAGYASFRHILKLNPDLIKLDISLTRDIDSDPMRSALAGALIRFAQETGSHIIAEGIETASELDTLRRLQVSMAQGYLIGYPSCLTDAVKCCDQS